MLESYLRTRGFNVFNISPSIPTEGIISFIKGSSPDAVLVSITLDDNIPSGKRLVGKIREIQNSSIYRRTRIIR
jgi:methanogenic corrinoid protein MtbC1